MSNNFGKFLNKKRIEKGYGLRELAEKLNVSPSYLSDVEHGRRNPFRHDKLFIVWKLLGLCTMEIREMYDLVGIDTESVPPDIELFVISNRDLIPELRKWIIVKESDKRSDEE